MALRVLNSTDPSNQILSLGPYLHKLTYQIFFFPKLDRTLDLLKENMKCGDGGGFQKEAPRSRLAASGLTLALVFVNTSLTFKPTGP